jgi:pyrrolidone-carboxylate peptidase
MLVTGFGAFRSVTHNPTAELAPLLSGDHQILKVTYPVAEQFARSLRNTSHENILCLGLQAKATELKFELYAHNHIGSEPGSSGRKHTRTHVRRGGAKTLGQTLASPQQLLQLSMATSYTPGDYLCNFLLYALLSRYPERRIGFVHVPPFEVVSKQDQLVQLHELIESLNLV